MAKSTYFLSMHVHVLPAFKRAPAEAKGRGREKGAAPGLLPGSVHHETQMSTKTWLLFQIQLQKACLETGFGGRGEMSTFAHLLVAKPCIRNSALLCILFSQDHMEGSIFPFYGWGNWVSIKWSKSSRLHSWKMQGPDFECKSKLFTVSCLHPMEGFSP